MPQVGVSDWLKHQDAPTCRAVAVRAALRVLPTFADELSPRRFGHYGVGVPELAHPVLLPTFRALAAGWFGSAYPNRGAPITSMANGLFNAALRASYRDEFYSDVSKSPPYDRHWIAAAMTAGTAMRAFEVGQAPADHAANTIRNASTFEQASYRAVSADGDAMQSDGSGVWLAAQPLWLCERPELNIKRWLLLKELLLADNADWSVWIRWYDARCTGQPAMEALEGARAALPDAFWLDGPRAVNREIARLEAAVEPDVGLGIRGA